MQYASLTQKSMANAQRYALKERHDFTKESWLAEVITAEFNTKMTAYEEENGTERLHPGELLTVHNGCEVVIPLLDQGLLEELVEHGKWSAVADELEDARLEALKEYDPEATREDLQRLVNPRSLVTTRGSTKNSPNAVSPSQWELVDPEAVGARVAKRNFTKDDASVPQPVEADMMELMCQRENLSRQRAQAILAELAYIRELFCPPRSELKPGQVVWIGIAIEDKQREDKATCYRKQVPLILTLQTEKEIGNVPEDLAGVNHLQKNQIARMAVEAYLQGSVLPLVDFHMLTFRHYGTLSKLVNAYMQEHEVILPTPGTIKDAGRAMTHKRIAVSLHMQGFFSQEIAKKTYHDEESIDRYLDLFIAVLILYLYDMPPKLMARVTSSGVTLIQEHLELVEQHFPDKNHVKSYLRERGVKLA